MSKLKNIPTGWKSVLIPEVLFFQEGPGVRKWQFRDKGIKLLNVGNINNGKINLESTGLYLDEEEANGKYSHFLVDEGDLLIACSGIVVSNFHNKIAFASKENLPLCLNTSTMRFKALNKDTIDLKYFNYYLQTRIFTEQLSKLITGSAQLNFGPSHIKKIELLMPSIAEQKKIVSILDQSDALVQKNKALITKYNELTQSLFLEMFGDPITNSKGWFIHLFKNIIDKIESGWSPVCENETRSNENEWAILKLGSVSSRVFKPQENKKLLSINQGKKDIEVKNYDLLFSRKNTYDLVGASAYVFNSPKNLMLPDTIFRLKYNLNVNPIFLWFTINDQNYRKEIQRLASGSAGSMPNISKYRLLNKSIYSPPIDLQNQFEEHVIEIEKQKEIAQKSLAQSESLFNNLLQKAFKGELI